MDIHFSITFGHHNISDILGYGTWRQLISFAFHTKLPACISSQSHWSLFQKPRQKNYREVFHVPSQSI